MKVAVAYPPLSNKKGTPLLAQNRQFQWFSKPTYIYPVVPASAATLLKRNGHEVLWLDAIAGQLDHGRFMETLKRERPDIIAMESKTPVIKRHWRLVDELLESLEWRPYTVLMGDHVTALPEETMRNCGVDFVLTGGDYDFLLANLCDYLSGRIDRSQLEPGIWLRENGDVADTGRFTLKHDLNSLPYIDRQLTNWQLYARRNGNFRYRPATYIMSARDCWWGRCSFCSWTTLYPGHNWRSRDPENVLDEIGLLIENQGVREIMDDSGTFPVGGWLRRFCRGMIDRGYNRKTAVSCNMRFGALGDRDWRLMKQAGFRFVLFGLESANQSTLDRINKDLKVERITADLRLAKEAGLSPHVTVMVGYPWESKEDIGRTVELTKTLFRQGLVDTLQATIVIPYPGTPLFKQCRRLGRLETENWDDYDMSRPVTAGAMTGREIAAMTQALYKSCLSPAFVMGKVLSIRRPSDIHFFWRAARAVGSHLRDFMWSASEGD